jgi:hypothetical protein
MSERLPDAFYEPPVVPQPDTTRAEEFLQRLNEPKPEHIQQHWEVPGMDYHWLVEWFFVGFVAVMFICSITLVISVLAQVFAKDPGPSPHNYFQQGGYGS